MDQHAIDEVLNRPLSQELLALRRNPAVALTIDTESHPLKVLLIRGKAELDVVDGIPDESLYDGMVRVVVKPTWANLIDFETTLPTAIEELMRRQKERQRA